MVDSSLSSVLLDHLVSDCLEVHASARKMAELRIGFAGLGHRNVLALVKHGVNSDASRSGVLFRRLVECEEDVGKEDIYGAVGHGHGLSAHHAGASVHAVAVPVRAGVHALASGFHEVAGDNETAPIRLDSDLTEQCCARRDQLRGDRFFQCHAEQRRIGELELDTGQARS